jgi:hypothetical protein
MKVLVAAFLFTSTLWAQASDRPKVYLNQNDEFSNAFAAGVQKKQVPVTLVTDVAQARYEVGFNHESNNGSKARGITTAVFTGVYADGSFERISMRVVDTQTKEIVYSYTCTKGRGGIQPAAECLAKHWKQYLSKH